MPQASRPITALICLLFFSFQSAAHAQNSRAPLERESPWLVAPTVSSDPKLGTTVGFVLGYLHRFDEQSQQSIFTGFGTYSNTDSYVMGAFADTYFGEDRHRIKTGVVNGEVRNEYDDFLGSGKTAKTEDSINALFFRYTHIFGEYWYLGGQAVSSNYTIGAEGALGNALEQFGLVGFDSNALGLVAEYDTRDNIRNPTQGSRWLVHNFAYRKSLGGDESFDAYMTDFVDFRRFGNQHVLGVQVKGRWTHDAPLGGYSSLALRGYTRGNYLDEHYTHIDVDARFHIKGRWGVAVFAGLGCLYNSVSDCNNSEDLYPAIGAGVIYTLKPEAGLVIRTEYAAGEGDNSAFYLRLGHPF